MTHRPTRPLRLIEMIRSLVEAQIDFIITGAVAVALHGRTRATHDLDIIVKPGGENIDRVVVWLQSHRAHLATNPDQPFAIRHGRSLHFGSNASLMVDLGEIDIIQRIIQRIPGMPDWSRLAELAERIEFEGMTLAVIDRATLIERKRARATAVDLEDVAALEALGDD